MGAVERLMRYCRIDTQSDPASGLHPSTAKQFDLANLLVRELKELGIEDAYLDEHCYVYGHLESNIGKEVPTVGFAAHMDTAPDYTGTGVNPRLIENFDGCDIDLGDGVVTSMADFPQMKLLRGKTLMVTDGKTLLGADDKAGITAIMEALAFWKEHPEKKHGRIAVAFTPDEEIGEGPMFFDYERFNAAFAYTMDGDRVNELNDETFNAASAQVTFRGFSIHPGSAKNKMINAAALACEYHSLLPAYMVPEHTEGREGFIHMVSMQGNTETAQLGYILRDHDRGLLEEKKKLMEAAAAYIRAKYGENTAEVKTEDRYPNMKEVLVNHPEVSETAWQAIIDLGYEPENVPVRGGTDGALMSFRGLPCPNLGTGGGNYHGRYEYCCMEELEDAVRLIVRIAERTAGE